MRPYHLLLPLLLNPAAAHAKDLKSIEQDLLRDLKRIHYWADYDGDAPNLNPEDSLVQANERFGRKLLYYTATEPATLHAEFRQLQAERLTIATAPNGQLRIYSWDTETGGTMHFFDNVFQYQTGSRVASQRLPAPTDGQADAQASYSEIFTVQKGPQTYYLGYSNAIYSSSDCYQQVKVFTIDAGQLNPDACLIRTPSGLKNTLGFSFDFFSVVDRPERPVRLITYDPATQILQIPVVWDKGKVTSKRISYRFNGQEFGKVK
ncbi:hypothetical protein [Hymenobacter sp. CRA2]|uniref:hypothetical protein n=1 Tax=Hymenobacter sp. CRA2 TaxID=1955620 RepID=UPI00098F0DCB|nr:hypothetical protein [Hymenobacter sp. CRA2]OON66434.1 hypothetical protein B0919_21600 [Hymenobacter sp. CRA2]